MKITPIVKAEIVEKEREWYQILTILVACLASITAGMLFSWSSPSIPKIAFDKVNYDISFEEASYFTVLPPVGVIASAYFLSLAVDHFGRKNTLWFMAVPHIVSWIMIATAKSVYVFYVARFITGIGDAALFVSLPTYVGEIATPAVRGSWGNVMTLAIYLGQFLINAVGGYTTIQQTAYISIVIPIIFAIAFGFMPETPYFYLMKGKDEEARKTLQKLLGKTNVEENLKSLKADVDRQMSESGTWKDLFAISSNRRALYAGIYLRASQQLGGIASFAVYTQYIFMKAGGEISATVSSMIFMGLCCVLNFCASFTLDRLGRRLSYFLSCLFVGFVLLIEAIYFLIEDQYKEIDLSSVRWLPVAGMIVFVFFYSFGLGIVPTLMLGELFSTSIKGKGLFILNIVFAILVSSVTKLFQTLDHNFGLYAPFFLFSFCSLSSAVVSLYLVPETKGKTLEEIQQSLKGKKSEKSDTRV